MQHLFSLLHILHIPIIKTFLNKHEILSPFKHVNHKSNNFKLNSMSQHYTPNANTTRAPIQTKMPQGPIPFTNPLTIFVNLFHFKRNNSFIATFLLIPHTFKQHLKLSHCHNPYKLYLIQQRKFLPFPQIPSKRPTTTYITIIFIFTIPLTAPIPPPPNQIHFSFVTQPK